MDPEQLAEFMELVFYNLNMEIANLRFEIDKTRIHIQALKEENARG